MSSCRFLIKMNQTFMMKILFVFGCFIMNTFVFQMYLSVISLFLFLGKQMFFMYSPLPADVAVGDHRKIWKVEMKTGEPMSLQWTLCVNISAYKPVCLCLCEQTLNNKKHTMVLVLNAFHLKTCLQRRRSADSAHVLKTFPVNLWGLSVCCTESAPPSLCDCASSASSSSS